MVGEIQILMKSENLIQVPKKTTTRKVERGRKKREKRASLGQEFVDEVHNQEGASQSSLPFSPSPLGKLQSTCVVTPFNIDNTYCRRWIFSYFIILT